MREIKFRAWDNEKKKMETTFCVTSQGSIREHLVARPIKCLDGIYILMQYTNLKDKNGREIWEGDIVKAQHDIGEIPYNQEIVYRGGGFCVGARDYIACFKNIEVIGNIYENGELLK